VLAFVNNDMLPLPGWLTFLLDTLHSNTSIAAVGDLLPLLLLT
jgi:hypothetical protein